MIVFPTVIEAVRPVGASLTILFHHPADRYIPPLTGFGCGEGWVTDEDVKRWVQAICAAAGLEKHQLKGLWCFAYVEKGVLQGLSFPMAGRVMFPEVCS